MNAVWTKLTAIEDVLIGNADEVVDYLRINYFTPVQQIRCMLSERAASLTRNSFQESTTNSISFRILSESDSPFDSLCDYVGFILYSYDEKSHFTLNERHYQRGDILLKNIDKIPNSSSILRSFVRNQQVYDNLYKSLLNSIFKRAPYERFIGLGITYEQYKWSFNKFIIGSERKRSVLSLDEQRLLEMYILSWTKNMNDKISIRDDARQLLDEQLSYVKGLLETQRIDMEKLWTPNEVKIAINIFEYEIQDEIDALFQTTPPFNTFSNLRDKIQSEEEHRLSLIAENFDHRRLTLKTQPSEPSLYQIWEQLKMVENWLHEKDFNSLVNFLNLNTFVSIESLLSIPVPLFISQLGICPESDLFDPTLDYIGFLIYLYNDQDEFSLNRHRCKRGQILIRQKEKFCQFIQVPNYRQISFEPLFIHEYLYEWYFKETPNEHFQGIGFAYEQNKWTFDVITYAGKHGIYSTYDIRGDNPMASNRNEQYSIDLILSTIYVNNKWKEELGRMYTIEELQSTGRESFRKQIESIEELFQVENTDETSLDKTCQLVFKNFIDQYRPKPIVASRKKIRTSTISQESINPLQNLPTLTGRNSASDDNVKQSIPTVPLLNNNLSTNPEQTQSSLPLRNPSPPVRPTKNRTASKPGTSFWKFAKPMRKTSSLQNISSPSNTLPIPSNSENHHHIQSDDVPVPIEKDIPERKSTLYQLWRELNKAEQQILCNPDLTEFIDYLTKKEYVNYSESVHFTPPDDQAEEYYLMAEIKIESQLKVLSQLFVLKRTKLFQQQSNQEKKRLDDLFKAFEKHYNTQIKKAKEHFKSK